MASGKLYGASNMTLLLQNERLPCSSEVLSKVRNRWLILRMLAVAGFTDRSFFQPLEKEENGDEDYEACFHQQGKKMRLTSEQVQFLERNFEVENKLEPERKVQLSKELGLHLQPRQVAIWFQNRRARFKTKQLEKDYGTLKASYDRLKGDYENLLQENEKLKEEVKKKRKRKDEEDNLSENLLTLPCLPKLEIQDACYEDPLENF